MKKNGTARKDELEARFVDAYFAEGENQTRAYLAIKPDVTYNTAAVESHRLLKNPKIHAAIEKRRLEIRQQFALTAERVYQELGRVSYFNPKRLLHTDGRPKLLHELDDDTAAALAAIEVEAGKDGASVTRFRPFDKLTALHRVVRILRLEDKPPPPPPPEPGEQAASSRDPRETAKRMAYLLRAGSAAEERAALATPRPKRKKLTLPAA